MPIQVSITAIQVKVNTVTSFIETIYVLPLKSLLVITLESSHWESSHEYMWPKAWRDHGSHTGEPLAWTTYFDSFPFPAFPAFLIFLGHPLLWKQMVTKTWEDVNKTPAFSTKKNQLMFKQGPHHQLTIFTPGLGQQSSGYKLHQVIK